MQAIKCELLARADEVVKDPDNATIRDMAVLILAILILLATQKGTSPTASLRPTTEARDKFKRVV
jgi:hypothetical protein